MDNDNDNKHKEIKIQSEAQNKNESNAIHPIEFRYDNPQFWSTLIPDIITLVFTTEHNANQNNNNTIQTLQYSIIEYLCKIGICIPCIYRICNQFQCISQQTNCNDLLQALISMERKTNTNHKKHCFICNDIYLTLYDALINNQVFATSAINEFEYKSYWMTLKMTPVLTIRDFYIVHHLHHAIQSSADIIIVPSNDTYDSHKDFIYFMIEHLSKTLKVQQSNENNDTNTYNDNKFMNKFGYTDAGQVDAFGLNITLSFYQHFISNHINISTLDKDKDKEKTMTKQSKKRDRMRQWKSGRKKRGDRLEGNNCEEYIFMKTFVNTVWRNKYHYLDSLKSFLLDLESFGIIVDVLNDIKPETFLQWCLSPWIKTENENENDNSLDVKIEINRPPIFIAAEYNKYCREISQTPFAFAKSSVLTLIVEQMRRWNVKENEGESKNNEDIVEVDKASINSKSAILNPHANADGWINIKQNVVSDNIFCCDHVVFHSAGREDMDVRMLGNGRPLLLQLMNPRKTVSINNGDNDELKLFETFCNKNVNGMIALNNVRLVDDTYQEWMKSIENAKNKAYRCLCWISKTIKNQEELENIWSSNDIEYPLVLKQWTPIRVLHRRSLAERTKELYDVKLKWISDQWISIDIVSEAGTYIKEFCHGDRGRTFPNLASLLNCNNANIIQLDVAAVLT